MKLQVVVKILMITALNTSDQSSHPKIVWTSGLIIVFLLHCPVSLHTQKINTILMLLLFFRVKSTIAAHPTARLLVEMLLSVSLLFQEL